MIQVINKEVRATQKKPFLFFIMKFSQVSKITLKSSYGRCFIKYAVLKIFTIFIRKQLSRSLFLINLTAYYKEIPPQVFSCEQCKIFKSICFKDSHKHRLHTCNFIKKQTLAQVFSCEFCQISKNTFYHLTHLVAASILIEKTDVFREDNKKRIQNPVKHLRWNFFQKQFTVFNC